MRSAHARTTTLALAVLFILPSLALLLPSASAEGSGTTIVTDAPGDHTGGGGAADLLRLGGLNDDNAVHFFVEVANANDLPAGLDYFISFHTGTTGTGQQVTGCDFFAHIQVLAAGAVANADVDTVYNTPAINAAGPNPTGCFPNPTDAALGSKTEHAQWVGNELRFDLPRADIFGATPADGTMADLSVSVQDDATGTSVFDSTDVGQGYSLENTPVQATAPGAPSGFTIASVSSSAIGLAWSAPASDGGSAITSYQVFRATTSGAESLLADVGLATSYTDSSVTSGATYYYTVAAVNAIGLGAASPERSAVAATPTLPGAPTGLTATAGANTVLLAWSAPADTGNLPITSYHVYRDGSAYATATGTSYHDDAPGTVQRTYAVAAVNGVGEGPQSGSASATAVAGPTFQTFVDPQGADRVEGAGPVSFLISSAGEPSVGVDQVTGDALIQVDRMTLKLHPADGTWTDVSSPFQVSLPVSDPIGWLDPATNRYFGGAIMGACSQIDATDDAGANWIPTSGACDMMPGHDHETIGGGAYPSGLAPLAAYPSVIWYCAHDNEVARCAPSVDGGLTFLPAQPIYQSFLVGAGPAGELATCNGLHGHVRVAPNGTAVVPVSRCGPNFDHPGAAISFDGLTWNGFLVPGMTTGHFDPSAAFGADGTLYYANCGADGLPAAAVSTDGGNHFATSGDVSGGLIKNCEFPTVIAGDGDRAAFSFLGTATAGNDQDPGFTGIWHLYVAYTLDRGQSWFLVDTTPHDPVQAGCIDAGGTVGQATGSGCANRNLLDFMDSTTDPRGYVVVGYPDGCVGACVTNPSHATSTSAFAAIAYQTGGECLYAARCADPAPSGSHPPGLLPGVPGVGLPSQLTDGDVCNPNLVVFSRVPNQPVALDYHAEACSVEGLTGVAPADTRVLLPQAVSVQLRYSVDVPGADHLVAVFSGLGADGAAKTMTRTVGTTGGVTYDSPNVAINPALSGEITMRVYKPDNTLLGTTTFHTAT